MSQTVKYGKSTRHKEARTRNHKKGAQLNINTLKLAEPKKNPS
jgi:hypothetical protein